MEEVRFQVQGLKVQTRFWCRYRFRFWLREAWCFGDIDAAAEAEPLARLAMGTTWPATSSAASNSLFTATRASSEPPRC